MPFLERCNNSTLWYEIGDPTDPWEKALAIVLHHGFVRSARLQ
jgi:hypothetical protein